MAENKENKKKRKIGFGHSSEDQEENALLCERMHFDAKEAYKLLRTNVIFSMPDNNACRKIGITSSIRGEGKSTVAVNLAYSFAETGARVLLIDMDMRLPSVAKKLKMPATKGLSDCLIGRVKLDEITFENSKYSNWHIIESGSIPPAPSELIGSENMKHLMKELETKYDYIIVDLPPVNIVSDALVAKELLDGYVLVVRQDYSDKRSLGECLRQVSLIDLNILGFVMTDSNGNSHYGSNYNKYYKKHYGSKYYKYGYKKYGYGYGYGYGHAPEEEPKE